MKRNWKQVLSASLLYNYMPEIGKNMLMGSWGKPSVEWYRSNNIMADADAGC